MALPGEEYKLRAWLARYGLILALVAICAGLAMAKPSFRTVDNLLIVLLQTSINGILGLGVTYVLLTGGVDLSLGSLVALTGVIAACHAHPNQHSLIIPIERGILAGLACGIVNGLVVTKARVAPFIATLGMMTAARGLALLVSGGQPVGNLSDAFNVIAGENLLGVPIPVWILAGVALASYVFLNHSVYGRYIYAVGGNEEAAHASGLNVAGIKLLAYSICGALAGLAGVIQASRLTVGQPNTGVGYELDAITAAVIGGTSLSGGVGTVGGTLLGALMIGVIGNGLDLLGVQSYYQMIVKGVIIVLAVSLDRRQRR